LKTFEIYFSQMYADQDLEIFTWLKKQFSDFRNYCIQKAYQKILVLVEKSHFTTDDVDQRIFYTCLYFLLKF